MARRAFLHLGMNKTGSSSIQRSYATYVDEDWRYLQLGPPNHSGIFAQAFLDELPQNIRNTLEVDAITLTRAGALAVIRAELQRDRRSVVISGEGLSNFCGRQTCEDIVGFLKEHVDTIAAFAYVREPFSFVASAFQQHIRQTLPDDDLGKLFPNYRRRLKPWVTTLGKRNVTLVPFDRGLLAEGDVIVDFAARAGLRGSPGQSVGPHKNESLSAEATALLYALRRRVGRQRLAGAQLLGARRTVGLLRDFGSGKFAFAPAALAGAAQRHAESIEWVEEKMGQPLPVPNLSGKLAFEGMDALLDYAATLGPALAEHLEAAGREAGEAAADPVSALERIQREFAERGALKLARSAPSRRQGSPAPRP